eukprot:gnl/MRDRNA2_/MRDRNA2_105973_c0_seq1.p1 gnl/MRDRNA2_/MRDRNA2_105973_c0~~gnl/MRDRNA2_/MRDRNA2_105973_c0_seq1.p1  ORF type:complete len:271 (-),score=60.29 gnl/MRDRNA2_/MRDRNA2_105973_c0_seq1:86-898(-)
MLIWWLSQRLFFHDESPGPVPIVPKASVAAPFESTIYDHSCAIICAVERHVPQRRLKAKLPVKVSQNPVQMPEYMLKTKGTKDQNKEGKTRKTSNPEIQQKVSPHSKATLKMRKLSNPENQEKENQFDKGKKVKTKVDFWSSDEEEIASDEAFDSEDERLFGDWAPPNRVNKEYDDAFREKKKQERKLEKASRRFLLRGYVERDKLGDYAINRDALLGGGGKKAKKRPKLDYKEKKQHMEGKLSRQQQAIQFQPGLTPGCPHHCKCCRNL